MNSFNDLKSPQTQAPQTNGQDPQASPVGGVPSQGYDPSVAAPAVPPTAYAAPVATQDNEPVSLGEWMWTILLTMIPVVNLVMVFVFAFASQKKSKRTFFQASLIWGAILVAVSILLSFVLLSVGLHEFFEIMEEFPMDSWDAVARM